MFRWTNSCFSYSHCRTSNATYFCTQNSSGVTTDLDSNFHLWHICLCQEIETNGRHTSVMVAIWVQALVIQDDTKIFNDFCGTCDSSQGILLQHTMELFPFSILKPFTRRTKPCSYKSLLHFRWGPKRSWKLSRVLLLPSKTHSWSASREWKWMREKAMLSQREARGCQSSFYLLLQPIWWNHIFPEWVLGR